MPTASQYIDRIEFSDRMIRMRTEGLTHMDTMKQLTFPANCMNWNLGHILVFRDVYLGAIDGISAADTAEYAIYGAGSEPLTDSSKAIPLETLIERLDESSKRVKAALLSLQPEKFNETYKTQRLDDYLLFGSVANNWLKKVSGKENASRGLSLGSETKELGDELILCLNVVFFCRLELPFPNHVHRFVTL